MPHRRHTTVSFGPSWPGGKACGQAMRARTSRGHRDFQSSWAGVVPIGRNSRAGERPARFRAAKFGPFRMRPRIRERAARRFCAVGLGRCRRLRARSRPRRLFSSANGTRTGNPGHPSLRKASSRRTRQKSKQANAVPETNRRRRFLEKGGGERAKEEAKNREGEIRRGGPAPWSGERGVTGWRRSRPRNRKTETIFPPGARLPQATNQQQQAAQQRPKTATITLRRGSSSEMPGPNRERHQRRVKNGRPGYERTEMFAETISGGYLGRSGNFLGLSDHTTAKLVDCIATRACGGGGD